MHWDIVEITEAVIRRLAERCAQDDREQAVYSIDAMDELQLHPLIQSGLLAEGYGVWPERRYPGKHKKRKKSEGERCDIVLTPENRPLHELESEATLFAPENAVGLESAFWLEIKTVGQFKREGPNERYGSELLSTVSKDLKKLSADGLIHHAGLMIVLFTEHQSIAMHDLGVWEQRCMAKAIPIGTPILRHESINNRMGHGCMTVALYALSRLGIA